MPNIDNPWPDRQEREDHEQGVRQNNEEWWKARNRQLAIEILGAQYELEREYENDFNAEMDGGLAEFFGISRADVRDYERKHGRKAI